MKQLVTEVRDATVKGAPREMLEELFQDFYAHRYKIYAMNLIRGICFGFGSLVGATILVTLLLWLLSLAHEVPFLSGVVEAIQHSIESARH